MGELMGDGAYEKMNIQWFPGHMTKAQRMIEQDLKLVDAVCELLDARIPRSSRNPALDEVLGRKPRLVLLNRADLADPAATERWLRHYRAAGAAALAVDSRTGKGVEKLPGAMRALLKEKLDRLLRVLAGIPVEYDGPDGGRRTHWKSGSSQ